MLFRRKSLWKKLSIDLDRGRGYDWGHGSSRHGFRLFRANRSRLSEGQVSADIFPRSMELTIGRRSLLGALAVERIWLLLALCLVGAVYFSTLSVNHTEAEDSLTYLTQIASGPLAEQFHPNHLLYNYVNRAHYNAWRSLGYTGGVELPVQALNIIASLAALAVLFHICLRLGCPMPLTLLCLGGTAFSYGFWWYSVECETYILPLPFVLLSFHRLLLIQQHWRRPLNHALLAAFNAGAILLHQQHVLLVAVTLVGYAAVLLADDTIGVAWSEALSRIGLWGATLAVLVGAPYLTVALGVQHLHSAAAIRDWALGHAGEPHDPFGARDLALACVGFGRAFIGGHFVFAFPAVAGWLQRLMPNFILREEVFLVQDFSALKSLGLLMMAAVAVAIAAVICLRIVRNGLVSTAAARGPIMAPLFAYLVLYAAFNTWWEPQNIEFWISLVPVVFLVVAVLISRRWEAEARLAILVACLLFVNLLGSVLPQTDHDRDYWWQFDHWFITNCRPGDLVATGTGYISNGYVAYYSGAKAFSVIGEPATIERRFRQEVRELHPQRIFFSSTLREPLGEIVRRYELGDSTQRLFNAWSHDLVLVHSDKWQEVYAFAHPRCD